MNSPKRVPPLSTPQRLGIVLAAIQVFSLSYPTNLPALVGKQIVPGQATLFSVWDLINYLEKTNFPTIRDYGYLVSAICDSLRRAGMLTPMGNRGPAILGETYLLCGNGTKMQRMGFMWLSSIVGPELLYSELAPNVVMITGRTGDGDQHVGSGIVIGDNLVLTCAHVLQDMEIDPEQTIQGQPYSVKAHVHPTIDVGLLEVAGELAPPRGLAFRDPTISEVVYNFGYPRITYTRGSALLMQRGEVTAGNVRLLGNEEVFLYSAIARPGNSGGPIVSETGHVVGIVTQDLVANTRSTSDGIAENMYASMPFYAGLPSTVIQSAVEQLMPGFGFPFETYED